MNAQHTLEKLCTKKHKHKINYILIIFKWDIANRVLTFSF